MESLEAFFGLRAPYLGTIGSTESAGRRDSKKGKLELMRVLTHHKALSGYMSILCMVMTLLQESHYG